MAFCKQCGAELNGAKFCAACGASAEGVAATQPTDPRQQSLAEMQRMKTHFGAKKEQYDEFFKVSQEIVDRSARGFGGWIVGAVIAGLLGILVSMLFFLATAGCIAGFVVFKKKNKEALAVATTRQNELRAELEAHYEAYGYCQVGLEYTSPEMLDVLHGLILEGRAITLSEAINRFLADIEQAEMHRLQEEATAAAKETAANTKKAAKQAKRAANYASASFWFK